MFHFRPAWPRTAEEYREYWDIEKQMPDPVRATLKERARWQHGAALLGYLAFAAVISYVVDSIIRPSGLGAELIAFAGFWGGLGLLLLTGGLADLLSERSRKHACHHYLLFKRWPEE